jgi:hypothetical protein
MSQRATPPISEQPMFRVGVRKVSSFTSRVGAMLAVGVVVAVVVLFVASAGELLVEVVVTVRFLITVVLPPPQPASARASRPKASNPIRVRTRELYAAP